MFLCAKRFVQIGHRQLRILLGKRPMWPAESKHRCMKALRQSDHRARRYYLSAEDYGLHEGPEYKPSGHIKREVWKSLVTLPDNVALQTTDHYSRAVETLHRLVWSWLDIHDRLPKGSPMQLQSMAVLECFDGAVFNALHGWYRIAGIMLRCAFEDMLIGLFYQRQNARWPEYEEVVSGKRRSAGRKEMDRELLTFVPAALLSQANALYKDELSVYVHRISENQIWRSNGPNFTPKALNVWIGQCDRAYKMLCDLIECAEPGSKVRKIAGAIHFKKSSER